MLSSFLVYFYLTMEKKKSNWIEQNDLETFELVDPVAPQADEDLSSLASSSVSSGPYWFKDTCAQLKKGIFQTPWDIYLDIVQKHSGGTLWKAHNFEEVFSPFMLCRFLSMDKSTVEIASFLSTMEARDILTNAEMYKLAYKLVKQSNWIPKYIKKDQDKKTAKKEEAEETASAGVESSVIFDI